MKFKISVRLLLRIFSGLLLFAGIVLLCIYGFLSVRFHGKNRINLPPVSQRLEPEKKNFKIAVFGDFAMQGKVLIPILEDISRQKYDFAVSIGDMFRKLNGIEGEYLLEHLKGHLQIPLITVPGNHDLVKKEKTHVYEKYFGQPYYFFSYGDTLFIVVNNAVKEVERQQLSWLEWVLKVHRPLFARCVIFMHIPPILFPEVANSKKADIMWADDVLKVIRPYSITAVVSGHFHISRNGFWEGIPVYLSPSAGQVQRDKKFPYYGYMELDFQENGGITAKYHHFPELVRGRNYLMCMLVNDFAGNSTLLYTAVALVFSGLLLFFLAYGKRKSPGK